jgi:hypothetical protein
LEEPGTFERAFARLEKICGLATANERRQARYLCSSPAAESLKLRRSDIFPMPLLTELNQIKIPYYKDSAPAGATRNTRYNP